tara:strand:- start:1860 stop:2426 length:567 start_codon:yes stop_codon:yes gene_type:complete
MCPACGSVLHPSSGACPQGCSSAPSVSPKPAVPSGNAPRRPGIVACSKCGGDVAKSASACPHCGAKRTSFLAKFFLGLVIFFVIAGAVGSIIGESSKTPADKKRDRLEQGFSPWDGSHYELVAYVKNRLKDPQSFEQIETRFGENDDGTLNVYMKFRARNSFGGMVIGEVLAKAKPKGELVEILSENY